MGDTQNPDFHDFWIFGPCKDPYLWIWIRHINFKALTASQESFSKNNMFGNLDWEIWKVEFGNLTILEILNFRTLKFWNLGMLKLWKVWVFAI